MQSTGSRHAGFSSCRAGSVVVVHGLLLPSTWDLHRPGIKPLSFASFALQGRFLTTGLPEKPRKYSSIYLSTFLYSPFCIKCPLCFGDVAIWQNKSSLFVVLNLYYIGNVVVHTEKSKSWLLLSKGTSSCYFQKPFLGTSLVVQWLRLHTPNAGCPGQGIRAHMSQLKISHAPIKTQHSQISKFFSNNNNNYLMIA